MRNREQTAIHDGRVNARLTRGWWKGIGLFALFLAAVWSDGTKLRRSRRQSPGSPSPDPCML